MSEPYTISVIIPFYNAKIFLNECINSLINQDFDKPYEIIMIDDGSTDNGVKIIKENYSSSIKLISHKKNIGPASARNSGLQVASGEFIYFLDVDDDIAKDTFKSLYYEAKKDNSDLVMSDKIVIKKNKMLREKFYLYDSNKVFIGQEITDEIKKRLYDPLYSDGLLGITGRLFKRSIIEKNNINFKKEMRYLEDETFSWDVLAYCNKVKYIKKQLYFYHIYPNVSSGISEGIRNFPMSNFIVAKNSVENCFRKRGLSAKESTELSDQALIYFTIGALVSFSRSIILKKINFQQGKKNLRKLISDILTKEEVKKAIKNYSCSEKENKWIPRAISWKMSRLLEFMCFRRAKQIISLRQNSH